MVQSCIIQICIIEDSKALLGAIRGRIQRQKGIAYVFFRQWILARFG